MSNNLNQAVRDNFIEGASYVARAVPTMSVVDAGSFVLVDCGLPSDTFNVVVARDLSDVRRLLDEGVGHFMAKGWPMALWHWEGAEDGQAIEALLAYGMMRAESHVAMVADLGETDAQRVMPVGFTIEKVTRAQQIQQYGSLLAGLFGNSDEAGQVTAYYDLLAPVSHSQDWALHSYLGIVRGEVVATGSLFVGRETIGIYDIMTRADHRRRGLGSAMFGHLLEEAKQFGHRHAVLQASADGAGIYRQAGFLPVGTVHTFENRGLLAGA